MKTGRIISCPEFDGHGVPFVRRKTTNEKVQDSFSIRNDFKNRNITNRLDEDVFLNFISKLILN